MTSVKTVDVSRPPMTTTAMLARVSEPAVIDLMEEKGRCHEDRTQTDTSGFDDGTAGVQPFFFHEGQRVIQQQRAVLSYKTVHNQNADEGIQIYRIMRQQ